jgi:mRNA-degrading endonuclease YafQ of YafQ-DinJ toxin-antitoxin module
MRFLEYLLMEARDGFIVKQGNKYKKGLKKHRHDKRLIKVIDEVMAGFAKGELPSNKPPRKNKKTTDRGATEYEVHMDGGNQVLMLYTREENVITLTALGSHKEIGLQ